VQHFVSYIGQVLAGVTKQSMFKQACLYGRGKAYFQSWEFSWKTKNKVKVYIAEEEFNLSSGCGWYRILPSDRH
jgi:hypothetical protein